jgi:CRISPR type II-A-associated protein Csn2
MIFKHKNWETELVFDSSHYIVSIEDKTMFSNFLLELSKQINGEEKNEYVLLKDYKEISIDDNIEIITDLSSFQINSKKIISLLYKKMSNAIKSTDIPIKIEEFNDLAIPIINDISSIIDLPLTYSEELFIEDVIKMYSVRLEEKYDSLVEKITKYINNIFQLKKIHCLIIYLAYEYLNEDDILQIYKQCEFLEITTIIFEGIYEKRKKEEKVLIIDKDCCEIIVNFEKNDKILV